MNKLKLKRNAIELGHFEAWLTQGKGSFHFENIDSLKPILVFLLKATFLYQRGLRNALKPVLNEIAFTFDNLPANFEGFKIMQLSDIHIDGSEKLADTIIKMIADLEVDLCVLTGDYRFEVYGPSDNVFYYMEKVISNIRSQHGIIGILGNHDFAETVDEFKGMGVKMLINESVKIRNHGQEISVIGVDDPHYYGCHDLEKALKNIPDDSFKLLLAHTPELYSEALNENIDLYLCGHTHGGQIRLPIIGPIISNANCPRRMVTGSWEFSSLKGYTNSGIGSSMVPVRFNCPPEICIITLKGNTQ